MGKRRHNIKGRQVTDVIVDNTETKKIKLDLAAADDEYGFDQSNALVLPSKKRETKIKKTEQKQVTRILSKKQRKNLEKIVEKKKKKEGRSELLEKLASVQLPANDLKKLTSIVNVQTKGVKKFKQIGDLIDAPKLAEIDENNESEQKRWSSLAGKKRKERLALLHGYNKDDDEDDEKSAQHDLNMIGTDQVSSSEDESEQDAETAENETENQNDDDDDIEADQTNEKIEENVVNAPEEEMKNEDVDQKDGEKSSKNQSIAVERRPAVYIHVERTSEVQAARLKLPILGEEQIIMEAINENNIVILAGETGSGKTTQVPQFLYEAGYAEKKMIGITEPRRVAAISMSKRIAHEMNLSSDIVSYLIRFEGNTTENTKIKFMTDGVLLKEIESDFTLNKYSVIILDEAHERSVYTDILVGLLSRIVPLRQKRGNPLKLIVMSATLRVEDFTKNRQLFKTPPPVLSVETRQFPVTIHFNKYTTDDYVKEAYNKTVKIHTKLPEGGILVFLTGQQEVNNLVRKLRKAYPYKPSTNTKDASKNGDKKPINQDNSDHEDSEDEFNIRRAIKEVKKSKKKLVSQMAIPKVNLDEYKLPSDDTEADLFDVDSVAGDESDSELGSDTNLEHMTALKASQPLWVLPLYSLLPSHKQQMVFDPPPDGTRLCVVSTNVAETSLTIPNIKYVVDCGRQKTRLYDKVTGVSAFVRTFTSKAAANQRAGRAGRTAAGHCYRLYSSAKYNDDFVEFSVPDIQKKPVEDLMLQMKCMGIDKVVNFPFPSPPDLLQLKVAEEKLILLGALEAVPNSKTDETLTRITSLGKAISVFPVAPRFGKMLALSHQHNLLPYTACLVAALSVQEVLIEVTTEDDEQVQKKSKWTAKRKQWAGEGNSLLLGDPCVLLRAVGAAEYAHSLGKLDEFCRDNGLRTKAVTEIRKLRIQLTNEINLNMPDVELNVDPKLKPPTDIQAKLLRQILLSGMADQVARLIPQEEIADKDDRRKFKYAYKRHDMEDPVFLHSSSVLRNTRPEWVVYQEIYEIQNGDTTKMFMRGVTAIESDWLLIYANSLCNIKSIKETPAPRYNPNNGKIYCHCESTFGNSGWEIPVAEIEMPANELVYKYFAMFFLNGEMFPQLKTNVKLLRSSPKNIVKSWAQNTPHILGFVNTLIRHKVVNKQKILDIWSKDQFYLLQEYRNFLIESASDVALKWPPIDN